MKEKTVTNTFDLTIKTAIIILALALFWFAFVYYPQIVNKFQARKSSFVTNVLASSTGLPYQNSHFKIEYSPKQNAYKITVFAQTLDQYDQYKAESSLALKNILSLDKTCNLNIIYQSNFSFVRQSASEKSC